MIVQRRPPWWQHRDVPCGQSEYLLSLDYFYTPYGEVVFDWGQRSLCQKWGNYDELIDSNMTQFTAEEWFEVIECRWLEIIVLDEMMALRARIVDLLPEQSQIRVAGVDILHVYLPVFRADPLRSLGDIHA